MPHLFYCLDLQPYTWTHLHRDPGPISSVLLACLGRNIQAVFNWPDTGSNSGLGDQGRVVSLPRRKIPHTGPHRPEKPDAFPQEKTGAAHPRVSLRPSHRLGLAHRAKRWPTGGFPVWAAAGCKKPPPGFAWQRSCVFVMGFAGILPILPRPPARRGISAAGNPPAPWRCPIPIGWR